MQQQQWGTILFSALALIVLANLVFTVQFDSVVQDKLAEAVEQARPAKLGLVAISNAACKACLDVQTMVSAVKSQHVNLTSEQIIDYAAPEARALVQQYQIQRLPTIILTGETDKAALQGFQKQGDALVFSTPSAPYTDAVTGKVQGMVTAVIVKDSTCTECTNPSVMVGQIKASGIYVVEEQQIEFNSKKGKDIIQQYKLEKVPVLLLSPDAKVYPLVGQAWPQLGSVEKDGWYVQRNVQAPYVDLVQKRIRGHVDVIYLTDKSCGTCYDVKLQKQILEANGVAVQQEKTLDVKDPEAQQLIQQYKIVNVPTFIVSGDFDAYAGLVQAWPQVGTKEGNVWVFRKLEVLGVTYKDLSTGKIVEATQE